MNIFDALIKAPGLFSSIELISTFRKITDGRGRIANDISPLIDARKPNVLWILFSI